MSAAADLTRFLDRAQRAAANMPALGKSVLFDLGDTGAILADARTSPVHIDHAPADTAADCTIISAIGDLEAMAKGELDPMQAMMSGKLKIQGDMGAALQLAGALRTADD